MIEGQYNGYVYTFETVDRVMAEAYVILKCNVDVFAKLETLRSRLMSMNAETQMMITSMAAGGLSPNSILRWRNNAIRILPDVTGLVQQVERTLTEELGIVDPYKTSA